MEHHFAFIKKILEKNGPDFSDNSEFSEWVDSVVRDFRTGKLTKDDIHKIREAFGDVLSILTVQGFVLNRPHGYPGDYEIIEKLYLKHASKNPRFHKWDQFLQSQKAAQAVRNRKTYFIELLRNLESVDSSTSIDVLNIASGPCRDILEFFDGEHADKIVFDNVEFDPLAISYAKNLCQNYLKRISWLETNAFKFSTPKRYRFIWSAGLFDYLNEKKFIFLLNRLSNLMTENSEIVIGNFSNNNPTQNYMELLGEWILEHRSKEDLVNIACQCGFDLENIKVGMEPEGVNYFLHLKNGKDFIPHPQSGSIV